MTVKRSDLTFERPMSPEPQTFAVDRLLRRDEIEFMRMNPEEFRRQLRKRIAHDLASFIAERTQLIDLGDNLHGDPHVRVQITFHDRGTYENWLPVERQQGRVEGVKQATDSLPYGMKPAEFYE